MAILLLSPLLVSGAGAAESAPVQSKRSVATLVTNADAVRPGVALTAGLRLVLKPGWHIYWRNPGNAGLPPSLDLTLSAGAEAGPLQWPVPERIAEASLTAYAYTGDVVLPFTLTPGESPLTVHAHAQWLVCRDICVPEAADLDLRLPTGPATIASEAVNIEQAEARVPKAAPFGATLTAGGTLALSGATVPPDITAVEFFPLEDGAVQVSRQPASLQDGAVVAQLGRLPTDGQGGPVPGVVTLFNSAGPVASFQVAAAIVAEPERTSTPVNDWPVLLVLAVAGGLLLNAMPCVFPILAMKAVALARLSGAERRRVRSEAASYSLGVVLSFVALGAGLAALRTAGVASGWGFQFQSPLFVTGIAWLLFAVGLSLSGVFTFGSKLIGQGDMLARRGGHAGSFLTGVLAVIVASPCTAPFMGTAIAGALTLPSAASLAVFAALGVGLALPYGLVALIPQLSALLPRPGPWMQVLQRLLAFPLYAAVVWLMWVVSQQSGPGGVLTSGAGLVAIGLAAWLFGLPDPESRTAKVITRSAAAGAVLLLGALLFEAGGVSPQAPYERFTEARLDELRSQGRPVFVNMTASWCLSCLVNERIALAPASVQAAFSRAKITYLKGDWTSKDPMISAYLRQLGQDGVPLYVLYPPGGSPVVLPQLLTAGTVLGELAKLKG